MIWPFKQRRTEDDFRREIEAHLALETDRLIAEGLSPDEARYAAARAFGNVGKAQEQFHLAQRILWLEELGQDVRYAHRVFRRSPAFFAATALTLALAIGATTTIFSVVRTMLLKPLPYPESDRLVRLVMNVPAAESPTGRPLRTTIGFTAADIAAIRSRTTVLEAAGTAGPALVSFLGYEDAGHVQGARLSSTVFPMLAARPALGRVFGPADDAPDAAPVVLLSFSFWQRHLGGDPQVVGRTLTLGQILGPRQQSPHVVVGIMPSGFDFPQARTQFWIPFKPTDPAGGAIRGPLLGRLAEGVSMEAAAAELGSLARDVRGHSQAITYELVRERDELVAPVKPALLVLLVAVTFVLLIACVNVANLLLARGAAREREIAIRRAIGAAHSRVVRQFLTESVLLATMGGVAGLVLAAGGVEVLRTLATTLARVDLGTNVSFPRLDEVRVDGSVLVFTLCLSVSAGLLCGIAPALRGSRPGLWDRIRGGALTASPRDTLARSLLVVAEIAVAMVLLVAGGLLIHSFVKLTRVDLGYDPENVLTFQVSLPADRYPDQRLTDFAEALVARIRSLPAVEAAAYANQLPMVQLRNTAGGLWRTPDPSRKPAPRGPDARFVSRDYLSVMGIRVIAGRGFREEDRAGRPRVLLVNQELVRREFAGENPIGQFVYVGSDTTPAEIVGIVDDVRQFGLDRHPEPQFFADFRQWSHQQLPLFPIGAYYAVRTGGDPAAVLADLRRVLSALDPQAKLFNVAPMDTLVASTISRPRMYAVLLGAFGALAATLAATGIFGVIAYSVAQRTREIGIRMALGAQRANVVGLVLRQSSTLATIGIALGLAGAAALTQYLEGMLFGVTPLDPHTFLTVALLFSLIALAAAFVPARRATRVDPLVALRHE